MAGEPTYRCPFKNNGATGITCENTNCGMYDATDKQCVMIQVMQHIKRIKGKDSPTNS